MRHLRRTDWRHPWRGFRPRRRCAISCSPPVDTSRFFRVKHPAWPATYPSSRWPSTSRSIGILTLKNRTLSPLAHLFIDAARVSARAASLRAPPEIAQKLRVVAGTVVRIISPVAESSSTRATGRRTAIAGRGQRQQALGGLLQVTEQGAARRCEQKCVRRIYGAVS